ncbi:MAG: hypothetical protein EBR82_07200 [Caulobacteraceae bacterium]|nr:hypothetical protein [Caulobacteraceae bacterium]
MPAVVQKWRRIMSVGCNHGAYACQTAQDNILAFRERFNPEIVIDHGDVRDFTAFRTGAKGTSDESADVDVDFDAGSDWLKRYRPTHRIEGNHDHRIYKLVGTNNAVISYAASRVLNSIREIDRENGTVVNPYHPVKQWFEFGGYKWGHGIYYNEQALRDHAENYGNCVIAHLHKPGIAQARRHGGAVGYCVGMTANKHKMEYAFNHRSWHAWAHGCVWGEVSDTSAALNLTQCECGDGEPEEWRFPL